MPTRIHASCLSHQHNYLDLDPIDKDAFGLPLPHMTFDWNENEPRMTRCLDERCTSQRPDPPTTPPPHLPPTAPFSTLPLPK
jgi:hypothetical protein